MTIDPVLFAVGFAIGCALWLTLLALLGSRPARGRGGWLSCTHPDRLDPRVAHQGTPWLPARQLGSVWRCTCCRRRYVLHEHNDNVGSAWVQWCRRWLPWPR